MLWYHKLWHLFRRLTHLQNCYRCILQFKSTGLYERFLYPNVFLPHWNNCCKYRRILEGKMNSGFSVGIVHFKGYLCSRIQIWGSFIVWEESTLRGFFERERERASEREIQILGHVAGGKCKRKMHQICCCITLMYVHATKDYTTKIYVSMKFNPPI